VRRCVKETRYFLTIDVILLCEWLRETAPSFARFLRTHMDTRERMK
jgi:hypothetical protein